MLAIAILSALAILVADDNPSVTIPAVRHAGPNASAVALSVDGSRVAAGYGGDWVPGTSPMVPRGRVVVWDRKTGNQLHAFKQIGDILRVEFSRDGLYHFRLDDGSAPRIRNGESLNMAQGLALSPDGKQIVIGHDGGEARVWSAADLDAKPRLLTLDTPLAVFPLFLDNGKTLGLFTQPANGMSWSYDRSDPSGFKVEKSRKSPWADLYRYDLSADPPQAVHWRLQDASYRTHYARFQTTRGHPEVNSRRYVLSADGKTLLIGCNGCTLVDTTTGKIERSFVHEE